MKRAQLDGAYEDTCLGLFAQERRGDAHAIERPVATHETDMRALHGARQAERFDERGVDSRGVKPGARHRDRMRNATALDLQQGCASFLGGIVLAHGMIRGDIFRNVLVVGADVSTRMLDWTNRDSILLGDAGTAAVLSGDDPPGDLDAPVLEILGHFMRTDPTMADAISQKGPLNIANNAVDHLGKELRIEEGGPAPRAQLYGADFFGSTSDEEHRFFQMDGRKVYRFVKRILPRQGYLEVQRSAGLLRNAPAGLGLDDIQSLEDVEDRSQRMEIFKFLASNIDLFVPHGANLALNQELAEEMGIPFEKMYITLPMRTLRIGKMFMLPSPVCVVKILSRCVFLFPSSTGAKDLPSM